MKFESNGYGFEMLFLRKDVKCLTCWSVYHVTRRASVCRALWLVLLTFCWRRRRRSQWKLMMISQWLLQPSPPDRALGLNVLFVNVSWLSVVHQMCGLHNTRATTIAVLCVLPLNLLPLALQCHIRICIWKVPVVHFDDMVEVGLHSVFFSAFFL